MNIKTVILAITLTAIFTESPLAQFSQTTKAITMDQKTERMLNEFTTIVKEHNNVISVKTNIKNLLNPSASNQKNILHAGDIILTMNGNKINTVDELDSIYEAIPNNEEINIVVQRDNEQLILRKNKGAKDSGMFMTQSVHLDSNNNGGGAAPIVVDELGLMISESNNKVKVEFVIDIITPEVLKKADIKGSTIISVNGKQFNKAEKLKSYLKNLKTGDTITLELQKNGEKNTYSINKTEANHSIQFGG